MQRSLTASAVVALVIAFTSPLAAQWPLHPVGVPKGPDGKTAPGCAQHHARPMEEPDFSVAVDDSRQQSRGPLQRRAAVQPWAADLQKQNAPREGGLDASRRPLSPAGLFTNHVDPQPPQRFLFRCLTHLLIIYEFD